MAKRVFQIAYDLGLMTTRELVLKTRGYQVVSVFGSAAARQALSQSSNYDLFIVGHDAPAEHRQAMVQWLKASFPNVRVLSLNPPHHGGVSSADYNVSLNGPEEWLRVVVSAIG
jgi:hypothetical protein